MASVLTGTLQYAMGILGGIAALLTLALLHRLRADPDLENLNFQADTDLTVREFEGLMGASVLMFVGFLLLFLGGLYSVPGLTLAARFIELFYLIALIGLFYRWWSRFQ